MTPGRGRLSVHSDSDTTRLPTSKAIVHPSSFVLAACARFAVDLVDLAPEPVVLVRMRQVLVATIARTDVACAIPGAIRSSGVQTPSGVDCQRQPAADASPIEFAPRSEEHTSQLQSLKQ